MSLWQLLLSLGICQSCEDKPISSKEMGLRKYHAMMIHGLPPIVQMEKLRLRAAPSLAGRALSPSNDVRATSEHFPPFCSVAPQSPLALQGPHPQEPLSSVSLSLTLATLLAFTFHPHRQGCQLQTLPLKLPPTPSYSPSITCGFQHTVIAEIILLIYLLATQCNGM